MYFDINVPDSLPGQCAFVFFGTAAIAHNDSQHDYSSRLLAARITIHRLTSPINNDRDTFEQHAAVGEKIAVMRPEFTRNGSLTMRFEPKRFACQTGVNQLFVQVVEGSDWMVGVGYWAIDRGMA